MRCFCQRLFIVRFSSIIMKKKYQGIELQLGAQRRKVRGHKQTTMTRFCSLSTFVTEFLYFYREICIPLTFPVPPTYLPHLFNLVCERPLNFLRMKKEIITLGEQMVTLAIVGHVVYRVFVAIELFTISIYLSISPQNASCLCYNM